MAEYIGVAPLACERVMIGLEILETYRCSCSSAEIGSCMSLSEQWYGQECTRVVVRQFSQIQRA